jgi:hypothetical protein
MKLTNGQIMDIFAALNELAEEKFSAKLAWKIQMARTSLQPIVEPLYKMVNDVQMKHAIRDHLGQLIPAKREDGTDIENSFKIAPEYFASVTAEVGELMSVSTEVNNVSISLSDFPESFKISANTMAALSPIMVIE